MGWFLKFAETYASEVRSICQHLVMNQKDVEETSSHANERNKDQWQAE